MSEKTGFKTIDEKLAAMRAEGEKRWQAFKARNEERMREPPPQQTYFPPNLHKQLAQKIARFSSPIVGTKYHPGALDRLLSLPDNALLRLVREPNNPHDANAVAVYSGERQLGHLLKAKAAEIAPLMDANGITEMEARFDKLDGSDTRASCVLPGKPS